MKTDELKELCAALPGTQAVLYGPPSNILVYAVSGKKFAYFKTSMPEQWRFSLRASAGRFIELTDMPGVKPARYMGRFHWVTIVDVAQFPADYLAELVQDSYARAVAGLTRAQRAALD
ncbi:MmcQ/YjbR family DNA-binding protein [Janthinobacterium sp. SUN118]|uniref:MmcQ/YjbR family DNA-binding protein n=1 Tax=Janthinobacterium sp. SUN118 TaxID=3004100 RepID=UPI0025B12DD5|nr:MmcQ/YjbR family DNA-binding protein [Janthinobacterium sp. SUN118]MDN2708617.1 MmcQ/YjbR family DNA-binding protein [Janthinobacterium sp. SUN118]